MKMPFKRKRGSALFVALMLSFISLLIMGGLITIWHRLTHMVFPIRVYSSVKEAAGGGIKLLASYIEHGYFDIMEEGKCPSGTNPTGDCCKVDLKYQLFGSNQIFNNPVIICLFGYESQPGDEITGVVSTPQAARHGRNFVYGFNSTAYGPNNVTAYVEAVYIR